MKRSLRMMMQTLLFACSVSSISCVDTMGTVSEQDQGEITPEAENRLAKNSLYPNQVLKRGNYLQSLSGQFLLQMKLNGNLVIWDKNKKKAVWTSNTKGKPVVRLKFRRYGNIVLENSAGKAIWQSGTKATYAKELRIKNNGALVLLKNSKVIWAVNGSTGDDTNPIPNPNPTTSKTVYTTESAPDLDTSDRLDFKNVLKSGGYQHLGDKMRVTLSQFKSLLSRSDIKALYHSSHGNTGLVALYDQSLTCSNTAMFKPQHVIFATCLTLTSTCWKQKMGSTSRSILGYTKVSYDGIANTNAKRFANNIIKGMSYIKAWYASNTSINALKDRWCGYVREGGKIVEYSARSGRIPRTRSSYLYEPMDAGEVVLVNSELLNDNRDFESYYLSLKQNIYEFEANIEPDVTFMETDTDFLSNQTTLSNDDALAIANNYLSDTLPEDAVLEGISMIDADGTTAGYRVRYLRQKDGIDIRGNKEENHIELLINNNQVTAVSKFWPEITSQAGVSYESLRSVSESVETLGQALAENVREQVKIESVDPCFGRSKIDTIVPAHCFTDDQQTIWVVDATSGALAE